MHSCPLSCVITESYITPTKYSNDTRNIVYWLLHWWFLDKVLGLYLALRNIEIYYSITCQKPNIRCYIVTKLVHSWKRFNYHLILTWPVYLAMLTPYFNYINTNTALLINAYWIYFARLWLPWIVRQIDLFVQRELTIISTDNGIGWGETDEKQCLYSRCGKFDFSILLPEFLQMFK